ncbi:hypothetical protein N7481_008505 [Penicillium waksmanii]|uniref:uncharacterized protein n=1 Tax=Penicillium waksmanii TaxID=69791 RepID=UPI002548A4B6|nr:uncharacterized protein N7481_008505 [Penicillium waksmanii]KAJ5974798.1 hypothetical protein N7481_008505 [Penicillium waksmanii]
MTEVWPFALRARGVALYSMVLYAALLFNLFVNPIALAAIAWKYYIVFVCILVAATITIFFTYPETRGFTLEEMAILFDGDGVYRTDLKEGAEKEEFTATLPSSTHEETTPSSFAKALAKTPVDLTNTVFKPGVISSHS